MLAGRYKRRHLFFRKYQLFCSECARWYFAEDSEGVDDDIGFPHWGWSVCPLCGGSNHNAKYLMRLEHYRPDRIPEHKLFLLKELV
uniref:Uncharacterized protein n=1 Tax=viral metagenome TaxID=1070528 RepID=A0A6M3IXS2_9ZZZZ